MAVRDTLTSMEEQKYPYETFMSSIDQSSSHVNHELEQ
jgi:hypothetical protein